MTTERLCEGCGRPLPLASRSDKRHHDDGCRQAALRRRRRERQRERLGFGLPPAQEEALQAAVAEPRLVALVASAGPRNWRAAAWLLERRHPERWALGQDRRAAAEDALPALARDPFAEVDELAERRRHHQSEDRGG